MADLLLTTRYAKLVGKHWAYNFVRLHQNSSPTHIYTVVDKQEKAIATLTHKVVLLENEMKELRTEQERKSKRQRLKRKRLQDKGSLSVQQAQDLIAEKELVVEISCGMPGSDGRTDGGEPRVRHCGTCGEAGHNAQTCQIDDSD